MTNHVPILYEDQQILVCEKPAGTATQSKRIGAPDMVSILKNHIHQTAPAAGEPYLAVIHRLDQPVHGILVFAKTPAAAKELNHQLQTSGFGKFYRALVTNPPARQEATLENYLVKDARSNTSRICKKDTPGAKLAKLHYRVLSPADAHYFPVSDNTAELDIHLDTGRHHQIRVQLAGMGCPISGDAKYSSSSAPAASGRTPLCLCAYRLEFLHPQTKKPMTFSLL